MFLPSRKKNCTSTKAHFFQGALDNRKFGLGFGDCCGVRSIIGNFEGGLDFLGCRQFSLGAPPVMRQVRSDSKDIRGRMADLAQLPAAFQAQISVLQSLLGQFG